jgi:hypothetical protein
MPSVARGRRLGPATTGIGRSSGAGRGPRLPFRLETFGASREEDLGTPKRREPPRTTAHDEASPSEQLLLDWKRSPRSRSPRLARSISPRGADRCMRPLVGGVASVDLSRLENAQGLSQDAPGLGVAAARIAQELPIGRRAQRRQTGLSEDDSSSTNSTNTDSVNSDMLEPSDGRFREAAHLALVDCSPPSPKQAWVDAMSTASSYLDSHMEGVRSISPRSMSPTSRIRVDVFCKQKALQRGEGVARRLRSQLRQQKDHATTPKEREVSRAREGARAAALRSLLFQQAQPPHPTRRAKGHGAGQTTARTKPRPPSPRRARQALWKEVFCEGDARDDAPAQPSAPKPRLRVRVRAMSPRSRTRPGHFAAQEAAATAFLRQQVQETSLEQVQALFGVSV